MIPRLLADSLKQTARQYPVVGLLGPRQSGKTTLAKAVFSHYAYSSLEKPENRAFALNDPNGFLGQFKTGVVLDEVQRVPDLLSYIQTVVDSEKNEGLFVLTGSQNFLLMEQISQSLAGRIALHKLLPLSCEELKRSKNLRARPEEAIFKGGYPRLFDKKLSPYDWLQDYVETYLQRDVRALKNIGDLATFHRFLKMTAARSGQLLNLTSLANDCGISHNTAKAWLSILEASFLIFLLQPHHKNFNKRLKKSPKVYFYDSGLLCHLLGIIKSEELLTHSMRGAIFETYVISELMKMRLNRRTTPNLYFWQDNHGMEIDCLIEKNNVLTPVEIKSGETLNQDYFRNLDYWKRLAGPTAKQAFLVYAGRENQTRSHAKVLPWNSIDALAG